MPWHMRGLAGQGLSTVVSLAYHLLSSASVELDLRTSYTIAISVSHTDPIKDLVPNYTVSWDRIKSTVEPIWAIEIS